MSKTSLKTTVEWHKMNWQKLERRVYKLQQRIYRASSRGDVKAVRKLQKMLMNSWSAKYLAIRNKTLEHLGKKNTNFVQNKKGLLRVSTVHHNGLLTLAQLSNPTQAQIKSFLRAIDATLERSRASSQAVLIQRLNRLIKEWMRFYPGACSRQTYSRLEHLIHLKLKAWAKKRHPNKSQNWIIQKYWHRVENSRWRFATRDGANLIMLIQG